MRNNLITMIPLMLYVAVFFALFGAWFALTWYPEKASNTSALVDYIRNTLALVTGHVLTRIPGLLPTTPGAQPVNPQAGRAMPLLLALLAALVLTACASFSQAVSGYEKSAARGLQAVEDNNIEMWTFNVCATPFSAAVRHPEIIAAMGVLCLPNGSRGDPTKLLDAVPK